MRTGRMQRAVAGRIALQTGAAGTRFSVPCGPERCIGTMAQGPQLRGPELRHAVAVPAPWASLQRVPKSCTQYVPYEPPCA